MSGSLAFIQPPVTASANLALENVKGAGGPLDREITISRRNTGYVPEQAKSVIKKLVDEDGAIAINGLTSTTSIPNWDLLQERKVPVVTMYAGSRFFDTRGGDNGTPDDLSDDEWFWRTTGSDSQHTAAAALFAKDQGAKKIGVLSGKKDGQLTWANAFRDAIKVIDGLEFTKQIKTDSGKSSYSSELESLFEADLDYFGLAMGVPNAVTTLKEWKQADHGGSAMLSNPLINPEIPNKVGTLLEDEQITVSTPAVAGPYAEQYRSDFESKYPNLEINSWAAAAYDAITVTTLAIEAAGEATPEAIQRNLGPITRSPGTKVSTFEAGKEALRSGDQINFQGAQTKANFTENGNVINIAEIKRLRPNSFESVTEIGASRIERVMKDAAKLPE
jgi:branched-chain amino acid transport system substrate-binding protein